MRIGLVGSHGVGKTTLVEKFLKRHPEYITPQEESRKVVGKGLGINFETNLLTQQAFLDGFFETFEEYLLTKNLITPRTLIDLCAYNVYFYKRPKHGITQAFVNQCIKDMVNSLDWWSMYAYIPIEFPITTEDKYRVGQKDNPEYQLEIDAHIRTLLNIHEIPFVTITGTVEERLDKLDALLSPNR